MVNFQLNLASMVGIVLAVGGAALYAVRSVREELSRDYDIFFAAVALLCGGILFFYGWRFDPIMQFGQVLLAGSAIFFAFENFRLRAITTTQAKRSTPIVDEDRPVSKVYRVDAELDEIEPLYEQPTNRRIRGTQESRYTRDEYESDVRRSRNSRRSTTTEKQAPPSSPTKPRRSRPDSRPTEQYDDSNWGEMPEDEEKRSPRRRNEGPNRPESRNPETSSRTKNSRPTDYEEPTKRRKNNEEVKPSDYVDYHPVEDSDDEKDNSGNFDY